MNRIAELRKQKDISQSKLGEIIGVAQNTICNWEMERRQPDNDSLIKMADLFGVTIDYILGRDNEDMPDEMVILNRAAKKMTPEQRQKLLNVAKTIFKEEFDD